MGAFFSGTDDKNEVDRQFYGVYGRLDKDMPEFVFRYVSNGQQINYDPSEVFTKPVARNRQMIELDIDGETYEVNQEDDTSQFKGPWPRVEYPAEWMDQHTVARYSYNKGEFGTGQSSSKFPSNAPNRGNINDQLPIDDFWGNWGGDHYDAYDYYPPSGPQGFDEVGTSQGAQGSVFSQQSLALAMPTFTDVPRDRPYVSILDPYNATKGNEEAIEVYNDIIGTLESSGTLEELAYKMEPVQLINE